jgi:hypothetical protein
MRKFDADVMRKWSHFVSVRYRKTLGNSLVPPARLELARLAAADFESDQGI